MIVRKNTGHWSYRKYKVPTSNIGLYVGSININMYVLSDITQASSQSRIILSLFFSPRYESYDILLLG